MRRFAPAIVIIVITLSLGLFASAAQRAWAGSGRSPERQTVPSTPTFRPTRTPTSLAPTATVRPNATPTVAQPPVGSTVSANATSTATPTPTATATASTAQGAPSAPAASATASATAAAGFATAAPTATEAAGGPVVLATGGPALASSENLPTAPVSAGAAMDPFALAGCGAILVGLALVVAAGVVRRRRTGATASENREDKGDG